MQVSGATSDEDSIRVSAKNLIPLYDAFKKIPMDSTYNKRSALREIFNSINPKDVNYSNEVMDIFDFIKNHK